MARVFNIGFLHQGRSYSALVSIRNETDGQDQVQVHVYDDHMQILLPHGSLRVMIADIMRIASRQAGQGQNLVLQVTDHISLHLLHPL